GESGVFRNEPIAVRDEERRAHPTSRAVRTRESCERRAASGTRADRIVAGPVAIAVVAEALQRCHTAEMGCGGKTSIRKVFAIHRARAMPGRHTSGDSREPR